MTIGVQDEGPRELRAPGESESVTVAFGDPQRHVYGIARVGRSVGEDGAVAESGLGMLFAEGELVAVRAGGVQQEVVEPLVSWKVSFVDEDDGDLGFDLDLQAVSAPAELDAGSDVAKLGGMAGYEQLVAVSGVVRAGRGERRVQCLGQRGHSWGAPDWDRLSLARTVGVWFNSGAGVTLTAVRPAKAEHHGAEVLGCSLLVAPADEAGDDAGLVPVSVQDPRLSTTYDGEGRQISAGLELYVHEDDPVPHRVAGEVVCGTTLDLGTLRLDSAFLHWRMNGREGVGRYDVLRRA